MASVLHVITGLGGGGAEAALVRLLVADGENSHSVVSLMDAGIHGTRLAGAGVPVYALGLERGRLSGGSLLRLHRLIRHVDPDVVQTWMYHADLVGGVTARLAGKRGVVWGIRNAYLDRRTSSLRTRVVARACAALSGLVPYRIVSCSAKSVELHARIGYARKRMLVIPNGFDLARYTPDASARERVRGAWGIEPDTFLIGMVARWDPQKDHANLIAALRATRFEANTRWRCALVGAGMTEDNTALRRLLEGFEQRDRLLLCGASNDVPAVMNALDLHVLSSAGEAFPNVVAEAMACGTPCVVTDVGDAAAIVGDTGWVVAPRAPTMLADRLADATRELRDPAARAGRAAACRARVTETYGLDRMVQAYRDVWNAAADAGAR